MRVQVAETIDVKGKKPEAPTPSEADSSDDGFEIEVVDDTPKADRNRKPSDPPEDVTEEELADYSEKFDDVFNTLVRDITTSVERKRRRLESVKS